MLEMFLMGFFLVRNKDEDFYGMDRNFMFNWVVFFFFCV